MIKLSVVLQEPVEIEIDDTIWKFGYLTLGDYKAQTDFREIALASLRKLQPEVTQAFVDSLPVSSVELVDVLCEVGGLSKKKAGGDGADGPLAQDQTG